MQGAEGAKKVLNVRMLGELKVTLDGEEVELPGGIYSKTMRLFLLLLCYGERGVTRNNILELLYGDGEYADESGSLRVASYRLKKQLTEAGILWDKGRISKKGTFMLEQEGLEVRVDVEIFQGTVEKALKEKDRGRRKELLKQACHMYTGEFLTALSAEMWVAGKQVRYQNMYFQCMRQYLDMLEEDEEYGDMLQEARTVVQMYPYEEWYIGELDALIGMERWKEAQETYQRRTKTMMDQMGVRPSKELEDRNARINNKMKGSAKNLEEIREELEEAEADSGAYYCSYQSFVGTYHYEMRRIERTGESFYLSLCSLTEKKEQKNSAMDKETFEAAVEELGDAIRHSLRRTDLYTRYGKNQYLMLLVGLKQEDCPIISSRIEDNFEKHMGRDRFQIRQFTTSASPNDARREKETRTTLKFNGRGFF